MSERLYSLLLRLYPRPFRERYAGEMARVFRDRLRRESTARLWFDVLRDAVVSIPRQHWVREPHPIYPLSAAPLRAAYATVMRAIGVSFLFGMSIGLTIAMMFLPWAGWRLAALTLSSLMLIVMFSAGRKARQASRWVKAIHAEATADDVTVAFAGMAPLTLQRSEVVGLHVFEGAGLRIRTADPARDLWVPARIASYATVRERLSHWAPTTVTGFFQHADNLWRNLFVVVLAAGVPLNFAGFVAGATLVQVVATIRNRDLPVLRKLLAFAPAVILLARWLW